MTAGHRPTFAAADAAWPSPLDPDALTRWAEVDPGVLRDNVAVLARTVGPKVAVMAVVKGNGYGHGAVLTARAAVAGGAAALGVSAADEALQLRAAGLAVPVLVMGWTPPAAVDQLIAADVEMVVWSAAGVAATAAAAAAARGRARVHFKLDTGMGRLGARPEEIDEVVAALRRHRDRLEVAAIMTHFADSGGDEAFTREQNRRLEAHLGALRAEFPGVVVHAANSAAALTLPETRHDMVRFGIAMYGYEGGGAPLQPALSMFSRVTHVKTVQPGESVGYGREWTAKVASRIATVGAGYADGIHRAQGNRGSVVVAGVRCPIVGRVSMDQITVDVSALSGVEVGDRVLIMGRDGDAVLGADEVAAAGGTISYEVLTSISARVPRLVV